MPTEKPPEPGSAPTNAAPPAPAQAIAAPPPHDAGEIAAPAEPMTPERMQAENRRNDLFLAAGVVAVAFLLASCKVIDPNVWMHLKAGWAIEQDGQVPRHDSFAYTSEGRPWIDSSWLFDWGLYRAELAETRIAGRQLADAYQVLLEEEENARPAAKATQTSKAKPIAAEQQAEIEQAIARLRDTAGSSDAQQVRRGAADLVQRAREAGLTPPPASEEPARYREIRRYAGPGGPALASLAVPVVIKAVLVTALAGILLLLRHPGPTLWWTVVVTVLALLGMTNRFLLRPDCVSLLLLAATLWVLHQTKYRRAAAIWLLVPIAVLWANIDSLFVLGVAVPLVFLIAETAQFLAAGTATRPGQRLARGDLPVLAAALAVCALATLLNPYGPRAWGPPLAWTQDLVSGADTSSRRMNELLSPLMTDFWSSGLASPTVPGWIALGLAAAALVSCVINWRSFDLGRLLVLLLFVGMTAVAFRHVALLSLAAGVALTLNGQEWFLRAFGSGTRITRGWFVWSQAGRAVTVVALALVAFLGITSRLGATGVGEFGYSVEWAAFDLDTGRFLRDAHLVGRSLNTTLLQGNQLIWSNYPPYQVYMDSRIALHQSDLDEFDALKRALRSNDREVWQPILDRYNVSHVILNINPLTGALFFNTFQALRDSDLWKLVHLDASSAVFGRVDIPNDHPLAADAAWFTAHEFDAARVVFHEGDDRLPEPPLPVSPPTLIDRLWQTRRVPTSDVVLADHFLNPRLTRSAAAGPVFIAPAENCFLAIRAARRGLAGHEVSPRGYAALSEAYFYLLNQELGLTPNVNAHELRLIQLLTALNQLVTADPSHVRGHLQLARMYLDPSLNFMDLAADHFDASIGLIPDSDADKSDVVNTAERLRVEVDRVKADLDQARVQLAAPELRAQFLLNRGCPGLAIQELQQSIGMTPTGPDAMLMLARLYIETGQLGDLDRPGAESAIQNIGNAMGMKAGAWEEMRARVRLMGGDYENARGLFEKAIAETRHDLALDFIGTIQEAIQGRLLQTVATDTNLTEDADRQARLEYDLGMLQLEAGEPFEAARHFKQSVEVQERSVFRPAIAFYLNRITGEELPPPPDEPSQGDDTPKQEGEAEKPAHQVKPAAAPQIETSQEPKNPPGPNR